MAAKSTTPPLSSPASRRSERTFVDDSTECAICFESFADVCTRPIITLACGHRWHRDCLVRQVEVGSMTASNDDQRILFHAVQCGKCGAVFGEGDHPDLPGDLLRSTDKLRRRVDALIDEHGLLEADAVAGVEGGMLPPDRSEALYKEARRKYAFYLCSHCKNPYFGGTVACADSSADGGGAATTAAPPRETRLCPACAPQSQTICQNPSEHGRYLTWKCRYCCKPATTVCYGNVHFCEDCHAKNSVLGGRRRLAALPCPGARACKYPRPPRTAEEATRHDDDDGWFHSNGSSQDCEQVYSCVLCESIDGAADGASDPLAVEAGSRNFLVNPSGREGLRGWKQLNPHMSWRVEGVAEREQQAIPHLLQTPVLNTATDNDPARDRPPVTTNFVSSYRDCAMAQTVDLTKVLRIGRDQSNGNNNIPRTVRIEVSARYTGRTDCPSVFALQAIFSDGISHHGRNRGPSRDPRQQRQQQRRNIPLPPQQLFSGTLETPPGVYWERTALELVLDTVNPRYTHPMVTVIVTGKDRRFWQGNFGSKVADITVRAVGLTPSELEALVVTPDTPGTGIAVGDRKERKPALWWAMVGLFGIWLSWWWHNSHGSEHKQ